MSRRRAPDYIVRLRRERAEKDATLAWWLDVAAGLGVRNPYVRTWP